MGQAGDAATRRRSDGSADRSAGSGRRALALAVTTMLLAACQSASTGTPGFRRLGVTPGREPLAGRDILAAEAGAWQYRITAGPGEGSGLEVRREATDEHGAQWVNHVGASRSEYWRVDGEGRLVMPVVADHDRRAITRFDPPLVIAPVELLPGQPFEQKVRMRVMDLGEPTRQKYAGTATQTMRYVDDHLLETPLGRLACRRVDVEFRADLALAGARTSTTLYVCPPYGVAVARTDEVFHVLMVPVHSSDRTIVLRSAPAGAPAPAAPGP